MSQIDESRASELKKAFVEHASVLFAIQRVAGKEVREKTMTAYGRLVEAHMLISGVVGSALKRSSGKIIDYSLANEEQDALFASLVIGLEAVEEAIVEGRYLQASALLRQEMETVAAVIESRLGKKQDGRTPHVGVLDESLRRIYSDLSAAAHVAQHRVVRQATAMDTSQLKVEGSIRGTRYYPVFDKELARRSFSLHLMLLLKFLEELSLAQARKGKEHQFDSQEVEAVHCALQLMEIEGVVK